MADLQKQYTLHIPKEDREIINEWLEKQTIANRNKSIAFLIKHAIDVYGCVDIFSPEVQVQMYMEKLQKEKKSPVNIEGIPAKNVEYAAEIKEQKNEQMIKKVEEKAVIEIEKSTKKSNKNVQIEEENSGQNDGDIEQFKNDMFS